MTTKLKPYPKYKNSGVEWLGDVPEYWDIKRLRFISKFKNSNVDKKSYDRQTPVLLCNYTDVYYNEEITNTLQFMKATASDNEIKNMSLRKHDVIITKDSESPNDIGIPAIVVEDLDNVVCGYHLTIFEQSDNVIGKYIYRTLQADSTKYYLYIETPGVTRYGLGQDTIGNLSFALPPLQEQTTITNYLDTQTAKIDTLITKYQRLIELSKEKRQAMITQVVTKGLDPNVKMKDSGVEWLGDVPEHWDISKLKYKIIKLESGTSVNAVDMAASDKEYGVLKTSSVYTGIFRAEENKTVIQNDIARITCPLMVNTLIVSRMNTPDLVGATGYVDKAPKNIYLPDRLWQVSFSCEPKLIYYLTLTNTYRSYIKTVCDGTSSSMQNLSQDDFKDFKYGLSSLREEQTAIVTHLDTQTAKIDTLIEKSKQAIELLKEKRTALITAAVTGKIDVRECV